MRNGSRASDQYGRSSYLVKTRRYTEAVQITLTGLNMARQSQTLTELSIGSCGPLDTTKLPVICQSSGTRTLEEICTLSM